MNVRRQCSVLLLALVVGGCSPGTESSPGTRLLDVRDQQVYPIVGLAGREWLGRNLDYATPNSWCYMDDPSMCAEEGRLYAWSAAQTACPAGWRLPNDGDWLALAAAFGGHYILAQKHSVGDPTQSYHALRQGGSSGFEARLSGSRDTLANGQSADLEEDGMYWSSSNRGADRVSLFVFNRRYERLLRDEWTTHFASSVRCVR